MVPFSVLYRGYEIDYNGSATFNVYVGGRNVDCFTNYVDSNTEAFEAIIEWIDENNGEYTRLG